MDGAAPGLQWQGQNERNEKHLDYKHVLLGNIVPTIDLIGSEFCGFDLSVEEFLYICPNQKTNNRKRP